MDRVSVHYAPDGGLLKVEDYTDYEDYEDYGDDDDVENYDEEEYWP